MTLADERLQSERIALDYLRAELGPRAPSRLVFEGRFNESPLEGEGPATLFSFTLHDVQSGCPHSHTPPVPHYVCVGNTRPNYFPSYGLNADDAYSFHIGTRFMLELGVSRADNRDEPPDSLDRLRSVVARLVHGCDIRDARLAALFRVEGELHAVYRLRLGAEDVYFMGADCPPGFYRMTDSPPQAAYRLHLGKLIRAEARETDS